MAYDRIMVGTDGSETAQRAEEAAARLAKACEAQLLVVTAYEKPGEAEGIVQRAESRAREQGLTEVRTQMQRGKATDVLVELSDQQDVDLLVLVDKGMSGGKRFLVGSVAGSVAQHGRTDILIVRTTAIRPADRPWGEYRSVLIGTDGSSTADRATRKGLELARRA
ncbi:MAG TPA: universal stress protein, partial [Actinomycetota bacterium]|nr:universal stress protein [Actinomycetota bacterium]